MAESAVQFLDSSPVRLGRAAGAVALLVFALTTNCGAEERQGTARVSTYTLSPVGLDEMGNERITAAALRRARENGLKFSNLLSIGSGLAKVSNKDFFGLTDRGPNGQTGERRTFPLPDFSPAIVRFTLEGQRLMPKQFILLKGPGNQLLKGLSNREGEEALYESATAERPLPPEPNGVDPEAIRRLPDGKFLLAEEYGPSLLLVNTNGEVLMRYLPRNKPLADAGYPIQAILPPVLSHRRDNRGFESLAVSPDGQTAWALLQSPAGDEKDSRYRNCRLVRAIRLDVSDPCQARVTGHFLVPQSPAADYGPEQKQHNVKFNDAEWLEADRLLLLEVGMEFARLVVADFRAATNLLEREDENSLAWEADGGDLTGFGFKPAHTAVWFSTKGSPGLSAKLEGLAVLSSTEIALTNDNDFGIGEAPAGEPSKLWVVRLPLPLPARTR